MRAIRRILAVVVLLVGGLFLLPAPSQAALPFCDSFSQKFVFWGVYTWVPTTTFQSGNMNCILGYQLYNDGVEILESQSLKPCHNSAILVDNYYDQVTVNTVAFMQAARGITVDGWYGPETRNYAVKFMMYDAADHRPIYRDAKPFCDYVRG